MENYYVNSRYPKMDLPIRDERELMPWISHRHLNLFDTEAKAKATMTQLTMA
jgi:hypothetical protein